MAGHARPATSMPLKNVGEAGLPRQKQPKKRSLRVVNEHFEGVFNNGQATQVVFQQPASEWGGFPFVDSWPGTAISGLGRQTSVVTG